MGAWTDPDEWQRRRTPEGCPICRAGRPTHVLVELVTCWVTAGPEAPLRGYVCVVAKEHVNEPFDLAPADQGRFWEDAMTAARAVDQLLAPVKVNYEIHGNTLPHLHLHLFPRQVDDPFVGGPIDPRRASVRRTDEELAALAHAIASATERPDRAGPRVRVSATTLSTPDVPRLAGFYQSLLGWDRVDDSPGWVRLRPPAGGPGLSFHHDDHFRSPTWPGTGDQQRAMAHLDVATDDLDAAVARALELGATVADHQPQPGVRVLVDPDGRPLCLFPGGGRGEHDTADWNGVA